MTGAPRIRSLLSPLSLRACLVTLLVFLAPVPTGAATLRGRVPEALTGEAGLRVVVQHLDNGRSWTITADPEGAFEVTDVPAGRVTAFVLSPDGDALPLAAGGGRVTDDGTAELRLSRVGNPDAAPTFNFILYEGEYYNNKPSEALADLVTVTGTNTTSGINIGLSPGGGTLSGRVTVNGTGAPAPGVIVLALGLSSFVISFDRTDSNGDYLITGIPADSFLVSINTFFFLNDNNFVSEYYNNTTSIIDADPVVVQPGSNTPGINFSLQPGGSISGQVLSGSVGGAGLPFAAVTARSVAQPGVIKTVITEADGTYQVFGLTPGSYTVHAEAETYLGEYFENKSTLQTANPVQVQASVDRPGVDFTLTAGGIIQGVVRHQVTSAPLAGILVDAMNTADLSSRSSVTDASGNYSIEGLATGTYKVSLPGYNRWYNNQTTVGTANPVSVTAGNVTSSIDLTVTPATTTCPEPPSSVTSIAGRVTEANLAPVPNAQMELWVLVGGNRFPLETAFTNVSGDYIFECLDPGTYYVLGRAPFTTFIPEWYNNTDSTNATSLVVTAGVPRTNVNFVLATGGRIAGRVTAQGTSTGLEGVEVFARNVATGEIFSEFTGLDGNYLIEGGVSGGLTPGNYKVWTDDYTTARLALVPVALARFTAAATPSGVTLEWTTTPDESPVGFHVYRSQDGLEPVRLTEHLLTGGPDYRFDDAGVAVGPTYSYWLGAIDRGGLETRLGPAFVRPGEANVTRLLGAAQNPLRGPALVRFSLDAPTHVSLRIFDTSGRLVRTLADDRFPEGVTGITWDARNDGGAPVPGGIYFLSLATPERSMSGKVVVAR